MLKNKILILGNGPSLSGFSLEKFQNIPSLGMNAAYRYWDRINWYPDIYCCLDDQLVVSHQDAILDLIESRKCEKFFLHQDILINNQRLADLSNVFIISSFLKGPIHDNVAKLYSLPKYDSFYFKSSLPGKITTGSYAIRFAAFLGYDQFYLIGIDCKYVELIPEARKEEGITLVISETPKHNPNYFFDDYQQKGDKYNVPNPAVHDGNLHLMAFEALRHDFNNYAKYISIKLLTKNSALYENNIFEYTEPNRLISNDNPASLDSVFISCTEKEVPNLKRMLLTWTKSETVPYISIPKISRVSLCIVFNSKKNKFIENEIYEIYEKYSVIKKSFTSIKFFYCELSGLDDVYNKKKAGLRGRYSYVDGPNNMFFRIMQDFSKRKSHILLLEVDCRPIKSNWLFIAEKMVTNCEEFWVKGSYYRGKAQIKSLLHINGCAIYNVGDEKYQNFLSKIFNYFKQHSSTNPMLSFDILPWEYFSKVFSGKGVVCSRLLEEWKQTYFKFQYTNFIRNISAESDVLEGSITDPYLLRQKYPNTYFLHGIQFYEQLPSSKKQNRAKDILYLESLDSVLGLQRNTKMDGIQYNHFLMSPHFSMENDSVWRFAPSLGVRSNNFLTFVFDIKPSMIFMDLVAVLNIKASSDCIIELSVARHGSDAYDGFSKNIRIELGSEKKISISGQLKAKHKSVKLQIAVIGNCNDHSISFAISNLDLVPNIVLQTEYDMPHLISINPDLKSAFGHYLHYDKKLRNVVGVSRLNVISLANLKLDTKVKQENDWIIPVFKDQSYTNYDDIDSGHDLRVFRDLIEFLNSKSDNNRKYIIYYYMTPYWNIIRLMKCFLELKNNSVKIVLNISSIYFPSIRAINSKGDLFKLFKEVFNKSKNIIFTTDSESISSMLEVAFTQKIKVLPTFSVTSFIDGRNIKDKLNKVIYYPSNSQVSKGFDLLEGCYNIASRNKCLEGWRFVYRWHPINVESSNKLKGIRERLKNVISWIDGELTEDVYKNKFEHADIILIPYRLSSFRNRTTGQLIDALLTKKPVIVTKGTWAAEIVKQYQVGRDFDDGDASSMATALFEVIKNFDLYKNNCEEYINDYKKYFREDIFINEIFRLTSFEKKFIYNEVSLKIANRLIREKSYIDALDILIKLYNKNKKFSVYSNNIKYIERLLVRNGEIKKLNNKKLSLLRTIKSKSFT